MHVIRASELSQQQRVTLFWKAPIVLYLSNTITSVVVTYIFAEYFIRMHPRLSEGRNSIIGATYDNEELLVFGYISSVLVREMMQLTLGFQEGWVEGLKSYFYDAWNVVDLVACILFFLGFAIRNVLRYEFPYFPIYLDWHDEAPYVHEIDWTELCYGVSLFLMCLKVLRGFILWTKFNLLVKIFLKMMVDVVCFSIMYIILLLAFAILMIGAGSPDAVVESCGNFNLSSAADGRRKSAGGGGASSSGAAAGGGLASGSLSGEERAYEYHYEYVSCWRSYWFVRTVMQAFGEFYMDEMTNDWSIVLVILTFFVMNIVLMNLLIAMMANTYETIQSQVELEMLLERYHLTDEFSRYSTSLPPPLNVIGLLYQLVNYLYRRKEFYRQLPKATTFLRGLDLFLRRDSNDFRSCEFQSLEPGSESEEGGIDSAGKNRLSSEHERAELAKLQMFMERSRKDYLEKLAETDQAQKVERMMHHTHGTYAMLI
jgi:hypothetical protein